MTDGLLIGAGDNPAHILPRFANRHGLIAGATGTGKTVTLQIMAEAFSRIGTPVFLADVKGDLAGLSQPGEPKDFILKRLRTIGLDETFQPYPTIFWDLFGDRGHPVRVAVSDIGPLLLARLLDLNDIQTGILNIAFRLADDEGLLLLDFKDLRSMLIYVGEERKRLTLEYGNISTASIGAIQRRLLELETQGAEHFFGEPAIDLGDLMRTGSGGYGTISVLSAEELMRRPRLYGTFLVWLMSELFEILPEVGDPDKPRLVLFFDEAHLLFDDAPDVLIDKIEQVVRLIRSKGVGVYFVTQNPLDVPETVLGQLGHRVQHALRAFTPRDQKAVRTAAETFRQNPKLDTEEVITQLGVGEALVSFLDEKGIPTPVERVLIRPPQSRLGPIDHRERQIVLADSPVRHLYDEPVDRESAFELLKKREEAKLAEAAQDSEPARRGRQRKGVMEKVFDSAVNYGARTIGRRIARGILGSILRW